MVRKISNDPTRLAGVGRKSRIGKAKTMQSDLERLLESWFVQQIDEIHAELNQIPNLEGWFSVGAADRGAIAFFHSEADALRFRLAEINRMLNG